MSSKTNISASTLEPIKLTHENGGGFWRVLLFSMWLCCCLAAPLLPRQAWAEGVLVIYADSGLVNGWQNWSWDAAIDFASTDYVHTGSSSIKVGYVTAWAGFRLNNNPFCSTAYTSLSFWVNGGTQNGRNIRVQGLINNAQQQIVSLDNYIEGGSVAAGAWRKVIIPLADLGVANNCSMTGFWLQEGGGGAQTPFYVDDISLLGLPPPASVNLSIDASQVVRVVDDRVFAVNAAIWDAALNTPETIALLQTVDNKILRFPGGSAANSYHWQTNISDGNNWQWASNFDAFANVARGSGAQAFITVNYGSGTPQEAAEWVRYSNVTKGFGFKYWEIGNENYGSWERDIQDRPYDPYRYAQRAKDYIDQMKAVDPTIKIGVVAVEGEDAYANYTDHPATNPRTGIAHNGWTPVLLATLKSLNVTPDFLIYHRYAQEPGAESDALLLQEAKGWQSTAAGLRQQLSDYLDNPGANVELVATENNSVSHNPGKQTTSLVSGLFLADSIGNIMQTEFKAMVWWSLRNGQETGNNNSAGLYGWRPYGDYGILSATNELYPTYYALKLMKGFARGGDQTVTATSDYDLLSVFAAKRSNGKLSLLVINKSPTNTQAATIKLTGFLPLANADVTSYGIPQDEAARTGSGDANPSSSSLSNAASSFTASFAPYSATLISLSSPTTQASQRSRLFVTSQHGSGNLGSWPQAGGQSGLAAGDQICQALADNAALGGTWKALLSTPGNDFRDRSTHNAKGYMQIDGTVVANSWDELFNPSCNMWQGKLNLTETGGIAADHLVVQTGTQCDGTVTTENTVQCGTNTQCSGWTSDSNWCVKGGTWVERVGLQISGYGGGRCGYYRDGYNWSDGALYCVEQGVASSFKLSVAKLGNGTGTVTPDSGTLSNNGTADYANGAVVVLTASADSGSVFVGWSGGGCAGTGACAVTLDAAKNVTASFNLQTCSYTASPDTQTFAPASATGSIAVTATPPDCAWTAASNDSWLTVTSGSGGTGNGTVGFTVGFSTNPGPRTGFLVVGGQRVAITQQGTAERLAYNGHEYQRVDTNQSFAQAQSHCESLSGHLATIASADENAFVYNNFVKGTGPAGENYMKLGGSDAAQEGVWAWITGEAWGYANWYPGSPDGGTTENYVHMANTGQWVDWLDTSYSAPSGTPSICEWDSAAMPVNGACGSANGQSFPTAPAANLCASGTVSALPTGSGPWSWSCNGSNGGTDSPLCTANARQSSSYQWLPFPANGLYPGTPHSPPLPGYRVGEVRYAKWQLPENSWTWEGSVYGDYGGGHSLWLFGGSASTTFTTLSSAIAIVAGGDHNDGNTSYYVDDILVTTQNMLFYGGTLIITGLPNTLHTVKVSGTTHLDGVYSLVQLMPADLAKGSWTQSNPMQTAKGSAVSVKLDARRYLLCGGYAGSSDVKFASCETYDTLTDTWAGVASMNAARDGFTMTKLADGRVLAVGGTGAGGGDSNRLISSEIYDPVANTWTYTGDLVEKAFSHAAVLMGNGKVLVVGGRGYPWCESHKTSQLYDPATGQWSLTGYMNYPRQAISVDNSLVKLPKGKIMVLGGVRIDNGCDASGPVPPPELYDPETGTWSPGPAMAVNRIYPAITVMPDSKVLVCGGNDNGTYINTCEVYDPATNAFTAAGVLSNAKDGAAAALLTGNAVMVAGGSDAASLFNSVDICDASGCVPAPSMNTARDWFKLLSKADGTVIATGGYIDSRYWTVTNASETYQASGVVPTAYTLFLSKTGTGTGSIAPDTGSIAWSGNAGTASYAVNTAVTLTVTPDSGSVFTGWSGACTGTGNCQVTMDAAKSVTATFDLAPVNGSCGSANGQSFPSAPTTNLCASGTVSAIPTGPGPWSWVCNGSNGGTNSPACTANVQTVVDGNLTVSGMLSLDTDVREGKVAPDSVAYPVTGIGANSVTTESPPVGFAIGDELLLINLQGDTSNYGNVGNYEALIVAAIDGTTVSFTGNVTKVYGATSSNGDLTGQKIVVQRVPNYSGITVNNGGVLTVSAWDGTKGGILAARVSGSLSVDTGGKVSVTGKGYRGGGGIGWGSYADSAYQGESYAGVGVRSYVNNFGGGGGGHGGNGNYGGSGGSYGTAGWQYNDILAGLPYGIDDLRQKIYLGSGGGGGQSNWDWCGATGGSGGGVVILTAQSTSGGGVIEANGDVSWYSCAGDNIHSGLGSGGSLLITTETSALPGTSVMGYPNGDAAYWGTVGGDGRKMEILGSGITVNGACGTASGLSFAAAPTTNLCASGTVSAIPTGPGPWSWVCNGSNGGTDSPLCSASVTQSITITTPAPASAAFNSQFTVAATASSGLPVVYSSGDPVVCTHDGANFTLVAPTGTCIVRYDQPGNGSFSAAQQLTSVTSAIKADQTIGVISLNPATLAVGGSATVSATGGLSGNPVTFISTTTGVCTVSGNTVTGVSVGSCSIAANQVGNANYNAAPQATQTLSVGKGNQAISFGAMPSVIVGGNGTVFATGGLSGNPVTFTSTTTGVCTVSGSTVTGVSVGSCSIAANQAGNGNYNPAPQVLQSFPVTAGFALKVINANSTGGTVTTDKGGISCGKLCSQTYAGGTVVMLTAIPVSGYQFTGWGGACSGFGNSCAVTMAAVQNVTANFAVFKVHRSIWKRAIGSIIRKGG